VRENRNPKMAKNGNIFNIFSQLQVSSLEVAPEGSIAAAPTQIA
jgi:hypothetical protein